MSSKTTYSAINYRYFFPWNEGKDHRRKWYMEYTGSVSMVPSAPVAADHLITVGRALGTYSLLVHYSPSGNAAVTGIGTGTGEKWSFELVHTTW
jgi:hypothetical protein